jgi:Zn-dependent peptidase ImmA (M78 family)/DNA-binding XRE family transcriptional regulator
MAINAVQLGERLRTAREKRGLSQQTVADALCLPRTAVTNMESGNRAVSTLELAHMAEMYGKSVAYFLSEQTDEEDLSTVLLRVLPEFADGNLVRPAIEPILDLYGEGAQLRRLLKQEQESAVPAYDMTLASSGDAIEQGEWFARKERQRLELGNAPINDVAELIASQGIWTAATGLPDWLSGLFLNHRSIGLAILINLHHGGERRRFSYAHEYAHALLDRSLTVQPTRKENVSDLVEKRANAFAAAFLMPADGIAEQLHRLRKGNPSRQHQVVFNPATDGKIEAEIRPRPGSQSITYQDVAELARHFRVSYEATTYRLKSLGHLKGSELNALIEQKDIGRRYIQLLKPEDESSVDNALSSSCGFAKDNELRHQLVRLATEAYRQGEISKGRLLELGKKLEIKQAEELLALVEAACAD